MSCERPVGERACGLAAVRPCGRAKGREAGAAKARRNAVFVWRQRPNKRSGARATNRERALSAGWVQLGCRIVLDRGGEVDGGACAAGPSCSHSFPNLPQPRPAVALELLSTTSSVTTIAGSVADFITVSLDFFAHFSATLHRTNQATATRILQPPMSHQYSYGGGGGGPGGGYGGVCWHSINSFSSRCSKRY